MDRFNRSIAAQTSAWVAADGVVGRSPAVVQPLSVKTRNTDTSWLWRMEIPWRVAGRGGRARWEGFKVGCSVHPRSEALTRERTATRLRLTWGCNASLPPSAYVFVRKRQPVGRERRQKSPCGNAPLPVVLNLRLARRASDRNGLHPHWAVLSG